MPSSAISVSAFGAETKSTKSLMLHSDNKTSKDAITHIAGHRDFQPKVTACPGENLEALLPGLAKELKLEFGTGGYVGPP